MQIIRNVMYLGNIGVGILFASYISGMKLFNYEKKVVNVKSDNRVNIFLNKLSKKLNIPTEKIKEFGSIVLFFFIVCILAVITSGILKAAIILILCVIWISLIKKAWEKKSNDLFQKNAYRLYRYLISQIMAGVKPKDVIISMYKITEDNSLKKILTLVSLCGIEIEKIE